MVPAAGAAPPGPRAAPLIGASFPPGRDRPEGPRAWPAPLRDGVVPGAGRTAVTCSRAAATAVETWAASLGRTAPCPGRRPGDPGLERRSRDRRACHAGEPASAFLLS